MVPLRARQDSDSAPGDLRSIERRLTLMGKRIRERYRDPRRHFIFEYYPWYGTDPWRHWDGSGRTPPAEISASSLPLLGAYDSRAARTLEQHARWIADAGVGAINLSWWGRGSYEDGSVHLVMDVMRAFDIKVTFHLEPYSGDRGVGFADDVTYILREYGDRRRWDTMLLLENADGQASPVFKSFVTLLSPTSTDCQGITKPVDVYVPDNVWGQQMARVRGDVAGDFDGITFVADSLDADRTRAAGFDAGAVGNPYIRPDEWARFTGAVRSTRHSVFVRGQRRLRCRGGESTAAGSLLSAAGVRAPAERAMGWAIVSRAGAATRHGPHRGLTRAHAGASDRSGVGQLAEGISAWSPSTRSTSGTRARRSSRWRRTAT